MRATPHLVCVILAFFTPIAALAQTPPPNLLVKDGQTVAFMGDSITDMGWNSPGGYIHLVVDGLAANGVKITPIPAGVGGNRSTEMLKRVDTDVIAKKPDWMLLSCGVNDVWSRSIDLDTFKKQITAIVDKAQAAHIQVMILTPTPIGEAGKQEFNDKLPAYVDFMKQLAKERSLPCADIHQAYLDYIATVNQPDNPNVVTIDGVHPNPDGHLLFAKTILAAFGATPDQVATAEKAWRAAPQDAAMPSGFSYGLPVPLTADELAALNKMAADQKMTLQKLLHGIGLQAALEVLTKNDPEKIPDGGTVERQWAAIVKLKVDSMTSTAPNPSAATTPQDAHVWFGGMAPMSLTQWDALKRAATARKISVPQLAQICLMEAVRDKLAAHPDLLPVWSDNITNEAHDGYVAKLDALAGAAPAPASP
jgi:lysophospholipase L1-like esterase